MRQSLSEREQAEDFSVPLCFTHRGNGTLIWFRKSPQCICRVFPISTSQNTGRWVEIDRQNELNFFSLSAFFFLLLFLALNKRVQSWGGSSSNQHFAAGEERWWKRDISTGSSSGTEDRGKERVEKQLRMRFLSLSFCLPVYGKD